MPRNANTAPPRAHLSDSYKIERRIEYRDHHRFTGSDMRKMASAVKALPTACIMTTEKDAQRMRDVKKVPDNVKQRLFYVPIQAAFLSPEEEAAFTEFMLGRL